MYSFQATTMLTDSNTILPTSEVVLPPFFPHSLTKYLQANGIDSESIFTGTRITADSLRSLDTRISHLEHKRLIMNAERAWGKPGLGLSFGSTLNLHSLGMIGQAARASRTIGEAIDTMAKYLALRSLLLAFSWNRDAGGATYSLSGTRNLGETERFMIEAGLAATKSYLAELTTHNLDSIEFHFKREPRGSIELYREVLGSNVSFAQQSDSLFIPTEVANFELTSRNQITAEEARRYCEAEITQLGVESGFKDVVYALLNSRLRSTPTETDTAIILGCSPRSLRRRLSAQNTTFRELISKARCNSAKKLLASTHLSIEDIAHEIGYINVGNFSRAFKNWVGVSPSVYRRQR